MAEIFRRAEGMKVTKLVAKLPEVQARLDAVAAEKAAKAAALLDARAKERTHTSRITVDDGHVDRYVVLDDTRGLRAALSIEYGRGPIVREVNGHPVEIGPAPGLYVLHDACGIPR